MEDLPTIMTAASIGINVIMVVFQSKIKSEIKDLRSEIYDKFVSWERLQFLRFRHRNDD